MASPIRKDVACFLHCVMAAIVCLIALAVPARAFADIPTSNRLGFVPRV